MLPLLFVLTMLIFHLALPNKIFSKEEKRYLTQWPDFHIEKVLTDDYGTKVELYFSDQFPFLKFWVNIQEGSNQILIKR